MLMTMEAGLILQGLTIIVLVALFIRTGHLIKAVEKIAGKKSLVLSLDIKCPSSGMHDKMIFNNLYYLTKKDQLKFVIKNRKDYDYAKSIIKTYKPKCKIFIQPLWGIDPKDLSTWILNDSLNVRLGLQLHKIVWGNKKGI